MDFVALAASLRMSNFSISPQSRFALKGVAGNIVHAIATTNAIAAGMMVVDAIKVLQNRFEACNTSWIARGQPHLISSQKLAKPNPKCYVCAQHTLELTLNTNKWNLKRLYEDVLGKKLSMNEPSVNVLNRESVAEKRSALRLRSADIRI
jgi:ubiquitin-like 1-activating enzyme E1 B